MLVGAAMLQQPRVPPTGQRQAVEIQIKWREVLAQKQALLDIMSKTTGHSVEKLDAVGAHHILSSFLYVFNHVRTYQKHLRPSYVA